MSAAPSTSDARSTRAWTRDAWRWAVVVIAAFALRVAVVRQYEALHPQAERLGLDEASYDRWARAIADGDWVGKGVFFQEPLYPYALGATYAAIGVDRLAVRLAQALLGALLCLFAGKLAERTFGRACGFATAIALAVYGPLLASPCYLLKEALFVPLFALFAWLLVRSRTSARPRSAWLVLGVLAGAGALLRGNVLVLLPFFAAWPLGRWWRARRTSSAKPAIACSLAFVAGVVIVLAPVLARNRVVGGAWVLTTSQAGTNLYAGNNAENPFGRAYEVGFVRGIPEHEADDWRRAAEERTGRADMAPDDVSEFWRDETLRSFAREPAKHLAILENKLRLTLGAYEVPDDHAWTWDRAHVPLLALPWIGFALLGALGLAGLAWRVSQMRARDRLSDAGEGAWEIALLLALYLATIVLTVTSDRARLPLVVLLAPFAARFVLELVERVRTGSWTKALGMAGACGTLAIFVSAPVLPASEIAEDLDEREFNLATDLAKEPEHLAEARSIAAGLVQRHPESARSRVLAGAIELEGLVRAAKTSPAARTAARERIDAIATEIEALADRPELAPRERYRVNVLLGELELARGEPNRALDAIAKARAFDPDDKALLLAEVEARLALAESDPASAADEARAIETLLLPLRETDSKAERAEVELAWARAELANARRALASADEAERRAAQPAVQTALRALQPIASDAELPASTRAAARRLAGRFQLLVGTDAALASAESHFRAAVALGDDVEASLGLAQTLVTRAERSSRARAELVAEARTIEERLAGLDPTSPALAELRSRLQALR